MKIILVVFTFLAFTNAIETVVKSDELDPIFASWQDHEVGTVVRLSGIEKEADSVITTTRIERKLVEKNEKYVLVKNTVSISMNGRELTGGTSETLHEKTKKPDESTNQNTKVDIKETGRGKENIRIGGTTYKCQWIETSITAGRTKSVTKVWTCKTVPGGVVKKSMKIGGSETVYLLHSYSK